MRRIRNWTGIILSACVAVSACAGVMAGDLNPSELSTAAVNEDSEEVSEEVEEVAEVSEVSEEAEVSSEKAELLDAYYQLALEAIEAEDYDTAKEYVDICFIYCDESTPKELHADLFLKRACINVIQGKDTIALDQLQAALSLDPELAEAYLVGTQIYSSNSMTLEAATCMEAYIALSGDTSYYAVLADLYNTLGLYEDALKVYDAYVEAGYVSGAEADFQRGIYLMNAGRNEEAIEGFAPYLEDENNGSGAYFNTGIALINEGKYEEALTYFETAQEMGGEFDGLLYNMALAHLNLEQYDEAVEGFNASIEKESYATLARFNLGLCKQRMGNYEEAADIFTQLISDEENVLNPAADTEAWLQRAECYKELGKTEEAIADLTVCIDNGYSLEKAYEERSALYEEMGEEDLAKADEDALEALAE